MRTLAKIACAVVAYTAGLVLVAVLRERQGLAYAPGVGNLVGVGLAALAWWAFEWVAAAPAEKRARLHEHTTTQQDPAALQEEIEAQIKLSEEPHFVYRRNRPSADGASEASGVAAPADTSGNSTGRQG